MISTLSIVLVVGILVIVTSGEDNNAPKALQQNKCQNCKSVLNMVLWFVDKLTSLSEFGASFVEPICPLIISKSICDIMSSFVENIIKALKQHVSSEKFCNDNFC